MTTLNEMIDRYNELKTSLELKNSEYNTIRDNLIKELESRNLKKADNGISEVSLRIQTTVSYKEDAIKVLKEIAPSCITYKIDTEKLNKAIENKTIDPSVLESHRTIKMVDVLTVK